MTRPNLNRLAFLALAIFILVLFCWATSYHRYRCFSHEGRVLVLAVKDETFTTQWLRDRPPSAYEWKQLVPKDAWHFAGLTFAPTQTINSYSYTFTSGGRDVTMFIPLHYWQLAIPYWLLTLLTAIPTALLLRTRQRQRARRQQGQCRNCGYDLRASPDRCPECGTDALIDNRNLVQSPLHPSHPP